MSNPTKKKQTPPKKGMSKKEQATKLKAAIPDYGLPGKPGTLQTAKEIQELKTNPPLLLQSEPVDPPSPTVESSSPDSPPPTDPPQEGEILTNTGKCGECGVNPYRNEPPSEYTEQDGVEEPEYAVSALEAAGGVIKPTCGAEAIEDVLTDAMELTTAAAVARVENTVRSDPLFQKFKMYLQTNWSATAVSIQVGGLALAHPTSMVNPDLWDFARGTINLAEVIYRRMMNDDFLLRVWPSLRIAMGVHLPNLQWSAGLTTTLACCTVIMDLPIIKQGLDDVIAKEEAGDKK